MQSIQPWSPLLVLSLALGLGAGCKSTKIDTNKAEKLIKAHIEGKLESKSIKVDCPKDVKIEKDATFECKANVDGQMLTVLVTQLDKEGNVSWEFTDGVAAIGIKPGTEKLVRQYIESSFGVANAEVHCPEKIEIKKGGTFECTAEVEGVKVSANVVQQDEKANVSYQFSGGVIVTERLNIQIQGAVKQDGVETTVNCGPAYRLSKPNSTFECTATDGAGKTATIAVKVKDDKGNVDWKVVEVEK